MGADETRLDELTAERRHLMSLAYRMLGTVMDAEDAVQETYARWYRMPAEERDAIEVPRAWLTRVAGRVCLDMLGSARARREHYVGEWLPEPLPGSPFAVEAVTSSDPLDRVSLDESVSTALMVVLDSLTPAERVVFVLHEVFAVPFAEIAAIVGRTADACRQLATSARRRVRDRRPREADGPRRDAVVRAFGEACRTGDLVALAALLDPEVVLRSDGGGVVSSAIRPVYGVSHVARFLLGIVSKYPEMEVFERRTADGLSFALRFDDRVGSVVTLGIDGDTVSDVWIMMNPQKLSLWNGDGGRPGGPGAAQ
jgi:RNA polymerase sigma-70 factor (ECF subfamily)